MVDVESARRAVLRRQLGIVFGDAAPVARRFFKGTRRIGKIVRRALPCGSAPKPGLTEPVFRNEVLDGRLGCINETNPACGHPLNDVRLVIGKKRLTAALSSEGNRKSAG